MDKISDEFEPWQDRIINFRFMSIWLWKKSQFSSSASLVEFWRIFLEIADKIDMDEISDERKLARSDH